MEFTREDLWDGEVLDFNPHRDSGGMVDQVDLALRHILGIVQTATNTASTQKITIYSQVVSPRARTEPKNLGC